ncbi:hypothetical protein R6Q59_005644 [Mikania micrantha]
MFTTSNPFSSSIHGLPPPSSGTIFGQEKHDVYFNHHQLISKEYSSFDDHASNPPPVKDSGLQNCDNLYHQNLSSAQFAPSKKRVAASKKDRHSKIFTAQGPRNRRVRLSIAISKKFFGLQDLLGFDKASKTLDWLFTKSKTVIHDLIKEMKHTSSSTLSDRCEEMFMEKVDFHDQKGKKKRPSVAKCVNGDKKQKTTQKLKSGFHVNLADRNQLRAEARSRARERTIEKLRIKNLNKGVLGDHNYSYLESRSHEIQSLSNHEVNIGKSLTEQKLSKPYSLLYNFQHDYIDSKYSRSQFKNTTN